MTEGRRVPDHREAAARVRDVEFNVAVRRLLACAGGMLAGAVLGEDLVTPDGSIKGMFAGLGDGVMFAAVVRDDRA